MKINVEHPDIPVVIDQVGQMTPSLNSGVADIFRQYGSTISAQQTARSPVDTGELASSNSYHVDHWLVGTQLTFENKTRYARFQEFGTGTTGAASAPEYMPPGLVWQYGTQIAGHKPQSFFYPPIMANRDSIRLDIELKLKELGTYAGS